MHAPARARRRTIACAAPCAPAQRSAPQAYAPTITAQPTKLPMGTPSHGPGGVHSHNPTRVATGSIIMSSVTAVRAAVAARAAGETEAYRQATAIAATMIAAQTPATARGTPSGATRHDAS
jgi:hypothetical protein